MALHLITAKDATTVRFIVTKDGGCIWINRSGTSVETMVNNRNGKKYLRGKSPGQRGSSDSEQSNGEKVHIVVRSDDQKSNWK
jgi:hypothetical protein